MKTFRRIMAVTLISATLLALGSCSPANPWKNLLSSDYEPSYTLLNNSSPIYELTNYSFYDSNQHLALFKNANNGTITHKIYSFAEDRVLATYTNSDNLSYDISLINGTAGYILKKSVSSGWFSPTFEVTYTLCDATGGAMAKSDNSASVSFISSNLFTYENAIYSVGKDGSFSKKMDLPSYMYLPTLTDASNDYYYNIASNSVAIYNEELYRIRYWEAPSYASSVNFFILDNGNVLIQYTYEADILSDKYDVLDNGKKLIVKQLLLDPVNKISELKNKAYFKRLLTAGDISNSYKDAYRTDKFENFIFAHKIEDKRFDNIAMYELNNKGKMGDLVSKENSIPFPIAKDRFAMKCKTGEYVIMDSTGKEIAKINHNVAKVSNGYITTPSAIYDTSLNLLYDLEFNDAKVLGTVSNTVFVQKEIDTSTTQILAIVGNSQRHIITLGQDGTTFSILNGIGYKISYSNGSGSTYYTVDGNMIIAPGFSISEVCRSNDNSVAIFSGINDNGDTIFYRFSK